MFTSVLSKCIILQSGTLGSICHMLGSFMSSANGKCFSKKVKTCMGPHSLCPFAVNSFISTFFLAPPASWEEACRGLLRPRGGGGGRGGRAERWAGTGQTRPGFRGASGVKAGYGFPIPAVSHRAGKEARHSAWKSGQPGPGWARKEEWAWNESSGRRTGYRGQRLTHLAPCPECVGGLACSRPGVTGDTPPPLLLRLQPNRLGLWSRRILPSAILLPAIAQWESWLLNVTSEMSKIYWPTDS